MSSTDHQVLKFINQTNQSIFLTGKAGTGKTTLLKKIIRTTHKNTVVVAPTGIAALNAGGMTIHSMFQIAPGGFVPDLSFEPDNNSSVKLDSIYSLTRNFKMSSVKQSVIRSLELLVIDEVSMLRADLLDAIDFVMRKVRRKEKAFGGVQVLFIGDLLQLPPVVKNEEWNVLQKYYPGMFFFHAHALREAPPLYIELKKIYRQSDEKFISLLNNLRNNNITSEDNGILSSYIKPDFNLQNHPGYIYLTTHNHKADDINSRSLENLKDKKYSYTAEIEGDFPEKMYPIEEVLHLKVGAQVMFIKNDLSQEKRYYNGKMGIVKSLSKDEIIVQFADENDTIEVEKYEWNNIRYHINENTREVEEEVIGTFVHYPLKLAWAITVHKSQGLTFEKAVLDVADVFQPGQAYVALSRLKSLDGLILIDMLKMRGIQNAQEVMSYAKNEADETTIATTLESATKTFIYQYLNSSFDFSNLLFQWEKHASGYSDNASHSEKAKHAGWAKTQSVLLQTIADVSDKFLKWLDYQFSQKTIDYNTISNKTTGAFDHFFLRLDPVFDELLCKIEEIKRVKRVKEYFNELKELEELTVQSILQLFRSKRLMELYLNGQEINKENLTNETIKYYRANKLESVRAKFKSSPQKSISNDDEPEDFSYYKVKPKKQKEAKKPTHQITYELWLEKKTIEEIASQRMLTVSTIQSHLSTLIGIRKIQILDVMTDDKIRILEGLFENYSGGGLSELKEKAGEDITYGELRMYQAHLKQSE
ncbi:MAG: helix-turn-helix domain-containing protein [Saprospiraceae bacterium]|nr:helix-turn-helix domain-containing protein [Saprospiraceae bacterium]